MVTQAQSEPATRQDQPLGPDKGLKHASRYDARKAYEEASEHLDSLETKYKDISTQEVPLTEMLADAHIMKWTVKALLPIEMLPSLHIKGPKLVKRMLYVLSLANLNASDDQLVQAQTQAVLLNAKD